MAAALSITKRPDANRLTTGRAQEFRDCGHPVPLSAARSPWRRRTHSSGDPPRAAPRRDPGTGLRRRDSSPLASRTLGLHLRRGELRLHVGQERLGVAEILECAELHGEAAGAVDADGRACGASAGRSGAVTATGGSGAAATSVPPSPGMIASDLDLAAPLAAIPMRFAAAYDRSMIRSCRKGPRSFTRTTTLLPVATLVTRA